MGTRSRIGMLMNDGHIKSVYCHWDGYPSYNGKILMKYYTDENKVNELISLGSISSLGCSTEYKEQEYDENFTPKYVDEEGLHLYTKDYHRWRNESVFIHEDKNIEEYMVHAYDSCEDYAYLYALGYWFVLDGNVWRYLGTVLEEE